MNTKNLRTAIVLTMMATAVVISCNDDNEPRPIIDPVEPPTVTVTRAESELIDSSNEFAFNLFRYVVNGTPWGPCMDALSIRSKIISPISITYALGMLNNGAAGATQAQINDVLGFGNSGADGINDFCAKMMNLAPTLDPSTKVMIANNIFLNKGYRLNDDFVQKAWTYYKAKPESRDFHDGKTMNVINKWASDNTEKMITKVLDEKSFDPDAVSYLLNAIYFKGIWAKKFDKSETQNEVFNHAGMTKELTHCPMMHQMETFDYAENENCQALRLPYGNGSFVMTVLLPKEETNVIPKVPTAEEWRQLNQNMHSALADVKLPRFETDTDLDLILYMRALGMTDAFDSEKADFRNFCDRSTYIGLMKQVAKIKLDEEGTEAAAVTVVGDIATARTPEPSYVTFHANHSFLYVISEQQTGAIFFIGLYTGY